MCVLIEQLTRIYIHHLKDNIKFMEKEYNHLEIEKKWQEKWEKDSIYKTSLDLSLPKKYILDMFPYPSGEGLHVGHPRGYIATDVYSRMKRMQGYNVLHPMGWDAFGLPAENFAIKNNTHPRAAVEQNIKRFKEQLSLIGFDYDWSKEINTTDPEFYKWTQWIFLEMFKKGLAYESYEPINWCPSCKTGLANEDVEADDTCERCGTKVEQKPMRQWVLKITDYADRMLVDLDKLPKWPEGVKEAQRNWIGRSEGAEIEFKVKDSDEKIKIFTTRADTIYGVTFLAVAGESDKFTGKHAINPANNEEIPIWEATYVLKDYGTGAIMGVPSYDERDRIFAEQNSIKILERDCVDTEEILKKVNGKKVVKYKIKDWVFSRQRYWGEPIPVLHCKECGLVPVPENELPIMLPEVKNYEPSGTGESPLANIPDWVNTKCSKCGGEAKRETNTMPQWAGSSWYYLRYIDPKNSKGLIDKDKEKAFMPVDVYVGGDHATRHLIYARFWHKFLFDIGVVSTEEPFPRLEFLGFILAPDGRKMSKRWGNVINPDDMVKQFGADAFRLYTMFIGPFENTVPFNIDGMVGTYRFLERAYKLSIKVKENNKESSKEIQKIINKTIKKAEEDIENFKFNTVVSTLMIFVNEAKADQLSSEDLKKFLKILAPFAPHMTEELWFMLGETNSIHLESWPSFDESKIIQSDINIPVQVNGKVRGQILIKLDMIEDEVKDLALKEENVKKFINNQEIKKIIYVKNRLINIVV